MNAYNKLIGAIVSTLLMRWTLRYLGFDAVDLGIEGDVRLMVELGIDAIAVAVNGFFVWVIPQGQRLRDWIRGRIANA